MREFFYWTNVLKWEHNASLLDDCQKPVKLVAERVVSAHQKLEARP
jgi:hypothetical protein